MAIDLESKKELLKAIEQLEIDRLNGLSVAELKDEYLEWFGIDGIEEVNEPLLSRDLLTDYMRYRQDSGVEELQELLVQKLKVGSDKTCDTCGKSVSDLEYVNRGGNCSSCQPPML
jgi:hypothetical protein